MIINIDYSEIQDLTNKLKSSHQVIKAAKKAAFEAAAPQLKQAVDSAVGGTGKVRSWQQQFVGSKGGYAAARPRKGTHKGYSVGHITNAINSGHRFPSPSGKNPRYRPRIRSGRQTVPGKHFYQKADAQTQAIASAAVSQVVEALTKHLEE